MERIESTAFINLQETLSGNAFAMGDNFPFMESKADRIRHVRELAHMTQEQFAKELGTTRGAVGNWELGKGISGGKLAAISDRFGISLDWLAKNQGEAPTALHSPRSQPHNPENAIIAGKVTLSNTIPVYGQAIGGRDGAFVLNGNKIADILAPASLAGIPDAYAVYVVGDSMEPRYFAGEAVFVSPRIPVRKGDFVVVQVYAGEGEPPLAYIKRFVSQDGNRVRLEQYNPKKRLEFATARVVSVHKIVMGGEG